MNDINILTLLKDCPKGTKLYSLIDGEVKLARTIIDYTDFPIRVVDKDGDGRAYIADGKYVPNGECLLFPSKEVRDWGLFNVKYTKASNKAKQLLLDNGGIENADIDLECSEPSSFYFINAVSRRIEWSESYSEEERNYILSTGTELKLEDIPKFKVGDVVKIVNPYGDSSYIPDLLNEGDLRCVIENRPCALIEEDKYSFTIGSLSELWANNKIFTLATPEEIAKWNEETLHPNHLHYSQSKRKIINWFLPFDKVVVRFDEENEWEATLFVHYSKNNINHYKCVGGVPYFICLPYNEQTAKLIGTTNEYKDDEQ